LHIYQIFKRMGFLSGIFGSGAYDKAIDSLEKGRQRSTSYYLRKAYEDPLQDSANAAALKQARDMLMANNKRVAASAAVTGASDESVALQKASANEAVANMMSKVAAEGTSRRDAAMEAYQKVAREYDTAIANAQMQKEQQETQALSGLLGTGLSVASTIYGGPLGGAVAKKAKTTV
jgi:hypothetical protein